MPHPDHTNNHMNRRTIASRASTKTPYNTWRARMATDCTLHEEHITTKSREIIGLAMLRWAWHNVLDTQGG